MQGERKKREKTVMCQEFQFRVQRARHVTILSSSHQFFGMRDHGRDDCTKNDPVHCFSDSADLQVSITENRAVTRINVPVLTLFKEQDYTCMERELHNSFPSSRSQDLINQTCRSFHGEWWRWSACFRCDSETM